MKPLQKRTEDRMFGHPVWNAFALLSPIRLLLNDKTNRNVRDHSEWSGSLDSRRHGSSSENLAPQP